jgi:hypothetical protein
MGRRSKKLLDLSETSTAFLGRRGAARPFE